MTLLGDLFFYQFLKYWYYIIWYFTFTIAKTGIANLIVLIIYNFIQPIICG